MKELYAYDLLTEKLKERSIELILKTEHIIISKAMTLAKRIPQSREVWHDPS
jgi:hypothetical protein